jgi:hypothetical protein
VFEDAIFNTTSSTYVETGVSLTPEAGINVILFRANASAGSEGAASPSLKATYAGSDIGESVDYENETGGHWNGIELAGWKVVDCDGVSEVKLLARRTTNERSTDVGAQQIISLPLGAWGLVEDTDYSLVQSEATTEITDANLTVVDTLNFTVPETGEYLVLWYAEGAMQENAGLGEYAVYGYVNEADPFLKRNAHNSRESAGPTGADEFHTWMWSEMRTIQAGANSYTVRAQRWNGISTLSVRRPRLLVISLAAFEGTRQRWSSGTDVATTSNSFVEYTPFSWTHNSAQSEQVLVIMNCTTDLKTTEHPSGSNDNVATYKIRDDTNGVDYATDYGERARDWVSNVQQTTAFALKEGAVGDTNWKIYIREANNTGGWVTGTYGSIAITGLTPK